MKNTRDLHVKALFSAEELTELKKECKSADVKRSPLLRDLALSWMAERKNSRMSANRELPGCGHNLPMSFSGRGHSHPGHGGAHQMRRRL